MRARSTIWLLSVAAALASACNGSATRDPTPGVTASGSASTAGATPRIKTSASAAPPIAPHGIAALVSAEQRRASADVSASDLSDHNPAVRRAAARALARIADARAAELLLTSLADEDAEVVSWSAYGLGATCAGRENTHVRALTLRATSLLFRRATAPHTDSAQRTDASARRNAITSSAAASAPTSGTPASQSASPLLDPLSSIAAALGHCDGDAAERTLRAWLALGDPLRDAAAWALGALASRRDHLEDATLVALLDAAARTDAHVTGALQAFTRLSHLDPIVQTRLYGVARAALTQTGTVRTLAIRALAAAGEAAAPDLGAVVSSTTASAAERADAARALARLGASGQRTLAEALLRLLDDPAVTNPEGLLSAGYGVLSLTLAELEPPPERAGPALSRLANLPVGATPPLARRTVALRCAAASILAGRGTQSPLLAGCDPDPNGRSGRLARLAVLGRGPLKGERERQWRALAESDDPVVRQRALELVGSHAEIDATSLLARALAAKTAGEVATAAHLCAEHPERASPTQASEAPSAEVTRALTAALERWEPSPNIEVRTNLADAAGRLGLLTVKPRLEAACRSDNPTLRQHAEKALRLLGDRARQCTTFEPPRTAPAELAHALTAPVHLELETDAGTLGLDLDPALAPVAVTRLVELAKTRFFDGVVVHRVVPGFVVQLGDPAGDGYGGVERPPLRCETSPARFEAGSVGIALSGRDTGSSQFFVTLGREAHLDGEYALIGHAGPGWDRVVEGDRVKTLRAR